MKKAEFIAKYGEEEYQSKLERARQYYQAHKEELRKKHIQWYQDNKEKAAEKKRQYYQINKEKIIEQKKQYYQENREKLAERAKRYRNTPMGRAICFCINYQQADKKQNRGDCTLTPDYIVEHIFPNGCLYCGEKDWRKLGCDRVDNSKPHTPDNVVCCCADCNIKRQKKGFDIFLYKSWRKRFGN